MQLGKIKPAGQLAIEAAKKDGRWDAAYNSAGRTSMPADFLAALSKNKKARAFFEGLNRTMSIPLPGDCRRPKSPRRVPGKWKPFSNAG